MPKFFFYGTSNNNFHFYPKSINPEQMSAEECRFSPRIWNINILEYEYQDFVLNSKNDIFKLPEDLRFNVIKNSVNYDYLILVSSDKICTSDHLYDVIFVKNQPNHEISWEVFEFTKETTFSKTVPRQLLHLKLVNDFDLKELHGLDRKKLENGSIYGFNNVTCFLLINNKEK